MDKCIQWYKRISLLSLFLFMFGILLINICIIGFSVGSSTNVVYAADVNGYYPNNLLPMSNSSMMNFNTTVNNTVETIYSDSSVYITLSGDGSIVDNLMTKGSSNLVFSIYANTSIQLSNTTWFGVSLIESISQNTQVQMLYPGNNNFQNIYYNLSWKYVTRSGSVSSSYSQGDLIMKFTLESGTVAINWFCLYTGQHNNITSFPGYVPPSYSNYGYDQGYTDGVNSASGSSGGITDLTNTTWLAPEYNVAGGTWGIYTVSGYVDSISTGSRFDFTAVSISSQPSFIDSNSTAMTLYNTPDEDMVPVVEGDLIFFTGGVDSTNSTLISWLNDNNPFLTYTDGYQDGYSDGYDIGHDIGYQEGLNYSDYQHGFDDGYTIGVDVGSQFLFSGYHLIEGNYTSGYVTSEFIADGKKYRGTLTRSSGQTNYLDDSVGTSSLISDGVYYAAYKIGSFTDGFAFSTYVGANAYPNNDVDTNLVYFYVIMLDPLNQSYIKVRLVDYSIILNRLRKNLTDYNNYYFKYIFPTEYSYDCYLVYDGYYNNTSIGQYLSAYQLQNFMTYYYDPSTVSDEYNTGVTVGYNEGYLQGNEEGYNSGYADYQSYGEQNYDLGYYNGHMIGYQEGLTNGSTNEYGFHTLLGAVFDVPVQTINGLLDFEILGVNMKGFYLGLISLCIALFILKIVFK